MFRIVVARYEGDSFDEYLKPCIDKNVAQLYEIWNEDATGLFAKYNKAIDMMIDHGMKSHDVVLFVHGDVSIVDPFYVEKFSHYFNTVPNVAIAGVIGSTVLTEGGGWHMCPPEFHKGQWIQDNTPPDKRTTLNQRKVGNFDDVLVVDGMCFAVRADYLLNGARFDHSTYGDVYHFYDMDFCLEAISKGHKVGIVDVLVKHKSAGGYDDSWNAVREKFLAKWKSKQVEFPLTVKIKKEN